MPNKRSTLNSFFDLSGFKPVSVGSRLRTTRKEKKMTIKDLAKRSGLSVNTISLVENEKSSPSVSTLEQIAQVLEIPLSYLFEPVEEITQVIHTQAGERREINLAGINIEDCGHTIRDQPIQPFIVNLPVGKGSGINDITHTGYEFVICLSGELNYYVKDQNYQLKPGDSLFFEADLPHRWENTQENPAKYLVIIAPGDLQEKAGEQHFQSMAEA